jgi:hypothetical protein|tara:strand:- start:173 stop:571 length:399 start_codon:yes stop_codon:yes gene_type:complete
MGDLGKNYATDTAAEQDGVWEPLADGIEIRVARVGNPNYQRIWEREIKPYRAQVDRGLMADDKMTEIIIKVMAEAVLLDWKNVEYEGKKLQYNRANALRILTELPDFRADVLFLANQQASYRAAEIEEAEKN